MKICRVALLTFLIILSGCATTQGSPEGFEGFVGEVEGRVERVYSDVFILRIHSIERLREDNRAYKPDVAEGQTFSVFAKTEPNSAGERTVIPSHRRYLSRLQQGTVIRVQLRQTQGNQLELLQHPGATQ